MRKILSTALALAAMASVVPSHADGGRTVTGTIQNPTFRITALPDRQVPVYGNPANSNGVYFRQARCAYVLAGPDSNGLVGWVVELEGAESDGDHTFTATSDAGNIAVGFYDDLGTCENQPPARSSIDGTFDTEGGEEGSIPFAATHAILVVEDARDANFTFTTSGPAA